MAGIVAVLMLVSQLFGHDNDDEDAAAAEPEPVAVTVPDLTGVDPEAAEEQLRVLGHRDWHSDGVPEQEDLSPNNRGVGGYQEQWTVVTTRPAAGQPWPVGEPIYLFSLQTAEWQWFLAHPTMPDVPSGVPGAQLLEEGQLLHDVAELTDLRYAPGHEPPNMSAIGGSDYPTDDLVDDPSLEPDSERAPRLALVEAATNTDAPSIATIPAEGAPLRMGQILTVTVGDDPNAYYSSGGGGGGYGYGDGDGDGDNGNFNVPGWACPTRWC